jgi:hypothetical protein
MYFFFFKREKNVVEESIMKSEWKISRHEYNNNEKNDTLQIKRETKMVGAKKTFCHTLYYPYWVTN